MSTEKLSIRVKKHSRIHGNQNVRKPILAVKRLEMSWLRNQCSESRKILPSNSKTAPADWKPFARSKVLKPISMPTGIRPEDIRKA